MSIVRRVEHTVGWEKNWPGAVGLKTFQNKGKAAFHTRHFGLPCDKSTAVDRIPDPHPAQQTAGVFIPFIFAEQDRAVAN